MGFFLLGRGREAGELRLISTELYPSRSDAIEALTRLSGEQGFEHRDAEVFVLDLDNGMPIVMVASAPLAAAVTQDEPVEESTDASAEPADEEPEVEVAEPTAEEPKVDAGVWETPVEDLNAEQIAVEDLESIEPAAEDATDGLVGAIRRAAGALESEGIVAPDSIGPSETPDAPADLPSVLDQPWLAEPDAEPEAEPEAEAEAEPEPAAEPDAAPEAEPKPDAETEPDAAPEPEPEAEPEAWPWDTAGAPPSEAEPAVEQPSTFVPDPFEEPATDPGDYLKIQIGDDSSGGGRTVVMGAYAEDLAPEAADSNEQPPEPHEADTEIDSMLADLGPVETPALPASLDPALAESPASLDGLTCTDCVYVNTCPNKEGLDPSKCGNFQWRSV